MNRNNENGSGVATVAEAVLRKNSVPELQRFRISKTSGGLSLRDHCQPGIGPYPLDSSQ
jgi:hypothetical protein